YIRHAESWRADCQIEGMDVAVALHAAPPLPEDGDLAKQCRVAWLSHEDLAAGGHDFADLDFIFTDSLAHVPFGGRRGGVHFLENISEFWAPGDLDAVMSNKDGLLSVLLPGTDPETWGESVQALAAQAQALLPEDIFVDDGSMETHTRAFERYRFSLIADDFGNVTVSLPFVRSLAFHTIPLFNGFTELATMVTQAIGDYDDSSVNLPAIIDIVKGHNDKAGVLWSYHRILQDQLQYRYNGPFEERLFSQACSVCRLHAETLRGSPPALAFVGIYSAKANFEKRQACRDTWIKVITETYGLRYKFFLGDLAVEPAEADNGVRREIAKYDDIV
ncbi:unnamed protein product, partial [Polarella glacialis]